MDSAFRTSSQMVTTDDRGPDFLLHVIEAKYDDSLDTNKTGDKNNYVIVHDTEAEHIAENQK